jgi:hypothetical protein
VGYWHETYRVSERRACRGADGDLDFPV